VSETSQIDLFIELQTGRVFRTSHMSGIRTDNLIGIYSIGSCKSTTIRSRPRGPPRADY